MPVTLVLSTFSKPSGGKSSIGAAQVAPALLTRMSRRGDHSRTSAASARAPSALDTSAAIAWTSPNAESCSAVACSGSALREEMQTRAPATSSPRAIISPIPRDPPVTRAVLPATENRSLRFVVGSSLGMGLLFGRWTDGRAPGRYRPAHWIGEGPASGATWRLRHPLGSNHASPLGPRPIAGGRGLDQRAGPAQHDRPCPPGGPPRLSPLLGGRASRRPDARGGQP